MPWLQEHHLCKQQVLLKKWQSRSDLTASHVHVFNVFLVLSSVEKGFHGHAHILPVVSIPLQSFAGYGQLKLDYTKISWFSHHIPHESGHFFGIPTALHRQAPSAPAPDGHPESLPLGQGVQHPQVRHLQPWLVHGLKNQPKILVKPKPKGYQNRTNQWSMREIHEERWNLDAWDSPNWLNWLVVCWFSQADSPQIQRLGWSQETGERSEADVMTPAVGDNSPNIPCLSRLVQGLFILDSTAFASNHQLSSTVINCHRSPNHRRGHWQGSLRAMFTYPELPGMLSSVGVPDDGKPVKILGWTDLNLFESS